MLARRMLMFVAVLFAVTALAAAFAPPPRGPAVISSPVAPEPAGSSRTITRTVTADPSKPVRITLAQGDRLHLEVRGDEFDGVELRGLAGLRPLGPDAVAVFDVLVDDAGSYSLILSGTGQTVATIDVTPPPRQGLAPAGPLIHRTKDT